MATFTSKASGGWDTEGQTTWNEAGHPVSGDTVTIANGHNITLESATTCLYLTINTGGTLNTTAANNWALTVTRFLDLSGTLTCNSSTISICSGYDSGAWGNIIRAGGIFTGGTGTHLFGHLRVYGTWTATTGNTTFNKGAAVYSLLQTEGGSTFTASGGTVFFINPTYTYFVMGGTGAFYNLTVNHASCAVRQYSAVTVANNLTITLGSWNTSNTITDYALTVTGLTSVSGTLTCNASTCQFGATAFNTEYGLRVLGTFVGGSGTHTMSSFYQASGTMTLTSGTTTITRGYGSSAKIAMAWTSGTFSHGNGTVVLSSNAADQRLADTGNTARTLYNFTINKSGYVAQYYQGWGFTLTIANDFTITVGTFNTSEYVTGTSRDLTVTGNLACDGTLVPNASTIHFNKAGTSTISGTGTIDFYKLTCSGSTEVNIDSNIRITAGGELNPDTAGVFNIAPAVEIDFL